MRSMSYLVAVAVLLAAAPYARAGDGDGGKSNGGYCVTCPRCSNLCDLSVTKDEVTKHCYGVECKTICIPCVVFPWQKRQGCGKDCQIGKGCNGCASKNGGHSGYKNGGNNGSKNGRDNGCKNGTNGGCKDGCCTVNNGAKTRCIRVLKKYEYKCPTCKYTWTPKGAGGDGKKAKTPDDLIPPEPPPVSAAAYFNHKGSQRVHKVVVTPVVADANAQTCER